MVKVSIILPNYNHAQYLQKRIDSILAQTFRDFELIMIDDKSTDNSAQVLEEYADIPQVTHLIFNKKNSGGPFGSWQTGFDLAQGEYIWIAESDDWADPLFLEQTVARLDANEKVGIAYTDSYIVNEEGKIEGNWKGFKNLKFNTQKWNSDYHRTGLTELLENLLVFMTINNMSACLIRRTALPDMTEIIKLKGAGDWLFCGLILLKHEVEYIAKPLNNYRTHAQNVTKENDKSGLLLIENMKFYTIILNQLKAMKIDYSCTEFQILDRFLFKYGTTPNISREKKKHIRKAMLEISTIFFLKFTWMLIKYRIKHFFK